MNQAFVVSLELFQMNGFPEQHITPFMPTHADKIKDAYDEACVNSKPADDGGDWLDLYLSSESVPSYARTRFGQKAFVAAHKAVAYTDQYSRFVPVEIPGGWEAARYAFVMQVSTMNSIGAPRMYYLIGYTLPVKSDDTEDNMVFHVTTILDARPPRHDDPQVRMNYALNVFHDPEVKHVTDRKKRYFSPADVFAFIQTEEQFKQDDMIDLRVMQSSLARTGDVLDNIPVMHLTKFLTAMHTGLTHHEIGDHMPMFGASVLLAVSTTQENRFPPVLSTLFPSESKRPVVFTMADVQKYKVVPKYIRRPDWLDREISKKVLANDPAITGLMQVIQSCMLHMGILNFGFKITPLRMEFWNKPVEIAIEEIMLEMEILPNRWLPVNVDKEQLARYIFAAVQPYKDYLTEYFKNSPHELDFLQFAIDMDRYAWIETRGSIQHYPWYANSLLSPMLRTDDQETSKFLEPFSTVFKDEFDKVCEEESA